MEPNIVVECFSVERSLDKKSSLTLEFSKSQPDDECDIMMTPIHDVCMDFLPGDTCMFPAYPVVNKAVIRGCGHKFHALSLVYHFMRNTMACPKCRHGNLRQPMSSSSFKGNRVVQHMYRRARTLYKKERDMQVEETAREIALDLQRSSSLQASVSEFGSELYSIVPTCSFFFFSSEPYTVENMLFTFSLPMRLTATVENGQQLRHGENLVFDVTTSNARILSNQISQHESCNAMVMTVTARNPYTQNPALISTCPALDIQNMSEDGVVVAGSLSDTVFTVEMFTPSQDDNTQQKTVQTIQFETPAYLLLLGVMAP